MDKNQKLASRVLELVGGTDNIIDAFHCMTRLRFRLKDNEQVQLDAVKAVDGVLGAQFSEGTLHVIIGPGVAPVYDALIEISGLQKKEAIEENVDADKSGKKITPAGILNAILNTFANSMTPLVPMFVAMGMVNVVAAIIGPTVLGLVDESSDLYNNFYYMGQAILYFLPVLVAITASRHFKSNVFISIALVGLLLYPDLITALGSETGFTVFGIAAPNVTYSSQILPVLLIVWVQSYVEKLLNRIIPDALKVIGVGFLTLCIMMPLSLCVLGPLGFNIGSLLVAIVMGLYQVAGPVETMLVGAVIPFITAFGFGRPIFFACLGVLMSTGVEYCYMPIAMVLTNFIAIGIAAGYAIKAKDASSKQLGATCLIANALGGVSEPTLFGIILPNRQTYLPVVVGGALSGLYLGIMKVGYYQFGPSNVLSVLGFVSNENSSNFLNGCIAAGIAFVGAFVMMLVFYKDKESAKKK